MNGDDLDELKRREEQKRDAQWDALERWRLWQEMIDWLDGQASVPRNSPAKCLELQWAKLAARDEKGP